MSLANSSSFRSLSPKDHQPTSDGLQPTSDGDCAHTNGLPILRAFLLLQDSWRPAEPGRDAGEAGKLTPMVEEHGREVVEVSTGDTCLAGLLVFHSHVLGTTD